jgi:hypothetical protein
MTAGAWRLFNIIRRDIDDGVNIVWTRDFGKRIVVGVDVD